MNISSGLPSRVAQAKDGRGAGGEKGVWERGLLGLFEKELRRLVRNLYIFTFNGSGEIAPFFPYPS